MKRLRIKNAAPAAVCALLALSPGPAVWAQAKTYKIESPDRSIAVTVEAGKKLVWSAMKGGQRVIEPSAIALQLGDGTVLGDAAGWSRTRPRRSTPGSPRSTT